MGTIEEEMPKSCDNMNASEDATVFIQIDPNDFETLIYRYNIGYGAVKYRKLNSSFFRCALLVFPFCCHHEMHVNSIDTINRFQ